MKLHGIRLVICSGDMQKWRLRLSDVSSTTEVKTNSSIQNKKSKIVQSTNLDETSCKILGVASNWMRVIKCLALQTRMKKNKYLWLINLHLPLPSWRVSYSLCYQTVDEINTRGKQSQLCCNYIEPSRLLIILSGF